MKKYSISLTLSLFTFIFCADSLALPLKSGIATDKEVAKIYPIAEEPLDPNMKKQAEFSCLKIAAMRLGNEMSLRITQVKGPKKDDNPQYWYVVGNKIEQDDDERPISFSCKMTPSDGILWNLEDFNIYQVSKEAVDQLKSIPIGK